MKSFSVVLIAVLILVLSFAPALAAAEARQLPVLSTNDLVENSYTWDGKMVSFKGEVLEDVMQRKDGVWMNVSDGNNTAMGVFVPKDVAMPAIVYTESYRTFGDVVLITGVFHRTCVQHEGETDIHATSVTVVTPGSVRANPIHSDRVVLLVVLVVLLGIVLWLYYRKPADTTRH